jgi:hypothetical protein
MILMYFTLFVLFGTCTGTRNGKYQTHVPIKVFTEFEGQIQPFSVSTATNYLFIAYAAYCETSQLQNWY